MPPEWFPDVEVQDALLPMQGRSMHSPAFHLLSLSLLVQTPELPVSSAVKANAKIRFSCMDAAWTHTFRTSEAFESLYYIL